MVKEAATQSSFFAITPYGEVGITAQCLQSFRHTQHMHYAKLCMDMNHIERLITQLVPGEKMLVLLGVSHPNNYAFPPRTSHTIYRVLIQG